MATAYGWFPPRWFSPRYWAPRWFADGNIVAPVVPLVAQPPWTALVPPILYDFLAPFMSYAAEVPLVQYVAVPFWGAEMPMSFPPVIAGVQIATLGLDFKQMLSQGVYLTGSPAVTITVIAGTDSGASGRIGAPQIGTIQTSQGGSGFANTSVLVKFDATGCPTSASTTYLLVFSCTASDGTNLPAWEMTIIAAPPG